MAQFETWLKADLQRPPQVKTLGGAIFSQDDMGNLIGAEVTDGGQAVNLSGTVVGYVVRGDGATVTVAGQCAGNRAWIELPEAAYAVPGMIQIALRLREGAQRAVLAACVATVQRTSTDTLVDPGHVVPNLETLLAKLEEMDEAIAEAGDAADSANAAAARVGTGIGYLAPAYEQDRDYAVGDYMTFNGKIYRCVQAFEAIDLLTLDENGDIDSACWETANVSDMIGDTAETAAEAAANELMGKMTVSATAVTGAPTASLSVVNGHYDLALGLVKGEKGDKGDKGEDGSGGLEDMAAILPVTTVSGPEVTFADAMEGLPLKSLVVEIDPVQEGSGTPSAENVRPITGRTGLRVQFPAQNGEELTKDWQKLRVYGPRKYPVGAQITVGAYDGKDLVWDVVDYGTKIDPSIGAARPCVTLLLHNLIPSHEFDTKEKFYCVDESVFPSGMPAGTYHFTCQGRTSPRTADNGVDFQFTLQYGISVGGYIMLDTSVSSNLNGSYLRVRATATAGYDRERAQITVGSEGTYLGTSDGNTPFMNQIMRAMGGSNMYAESNVRQWLNATGGPNAWWQANDLFDQPPTYPQFAGFLHDMDNDFVDAVAVTNVSCRANSAYVRPGYTTNSVYTVADKFFLPSRDEMGLGADGVAEGTVWAMYDGTDAASLRRKDTNQNQCNWLLRSPYPSTVASIRYVNTRGVISNAESFYQFAVSPACVLWLEMEETLDIDFPEAAGTVYGGTLDVVQGVLKVTKGYIESYQLTSIPSGWISSMDEYSPQKTIPTRGAQVVYDLDAPQVYALAPHAIKVVPGSNQYRADSGDVRVTYSMTIAGYVEKKLAELRAELEADEDLDTVDVELNE